MVEDVQIGVKFPTEKTQCFKLHSVAARSEGNVHQLRTRYGFPAKYIDDDSDFN